MRGHPTHDKGHRWLGCEELSSRRSSAYLLGPLPLVRSSGMRTRCGNVVAMFLPSCLMLRLSRVSFAYASRPFVLLHTSTSIHVTHSADPPLSRVQNEQRCNCISGHLLHCFDFKRPSIWSLAFKSTQ
jgi:hypothetical protein